MVRLTNTLGIGIDIVKTQRFRTILEKDSRYIERFAHRVLHPDEELPLFNKTVDIEQRTRILAGSWAIKEAVYKTLDPSDQRNFQFKEWYRYYNDRGRPFVTGNSAPKNEEFLISISHELDVLVATVLRQEIVRDKEEVLANMDS